MQHFLLITIFHNIGIGILRHRVAPLAQQAQRELARGHLSDIDATAIASAPRRSRERTHLRSILWTLKVRRHD